MLEAKFVFALIFCAMLTRVRGFPLEITALVIPPLLFGLGLLSESDFFRALGDPHVIILASVCLMAGVILRTGALDRIADKFLSARGSVGIPWRALSLGALLSAALPNETAIRIITPHLRLDSKRSTAPLMAPLALMVIAGGTLTLIGSTSSVYASASAAAHGFKGLGLLTQLSLAGPVCLIVFAVLCAASRRLLSRAPSAQNDLPERYALNEHFAEVEVLNDSSLQNATLGSSQLFRELDLTALSVSRAGGPPTTPQGNFSLSVGDKILVYGDIQKLREISKRFGLSVKNGSVAVQPSARAAIDFRELIVAPSSPLCWRSPAETLLRPRYRLSLLAINRQGLVINHRLNREKLCPGDVLLIQLLGHPDYDLFDALGLIPLSKSDIEKAKSRASPIALYVFCAVLLISLFSKAPLWFALSLGPTALLLLRTVRTDQLPAASTLRTLVVFVGFLCLTRGFANSGLAPRIAEAVASLSWLRGGPSVVFIFSAVSMILAGFFPSSLIFSVIVPLGALSAGKFGLPPENLIVPIVIASSCSFLTLRHPVIQTALSASGLSGSSVRRIGVFVSLAALGAISLASFVL